MQGSREFYELVRHLAGSDDPTYEEQERDHGEGDP
jgi:hypothetical protein